MTMVNVARVVSVLAALTALAGCSSDKPSGGGDTSKPEASETSKKLRTEAKARLAEVAALEQVVLALPAVTEDKVDLGGKRLKLGDDPNHDMLFVEQLKDPTKEVTFRLSSKSLLGDCARELKDEVSNLRVLGNCAQMPFLVVVRPKEMVLPKVDKASSTFTPGVFDVELFVIDMATKKSLGGIHVTWKSPPDALLDEKNPEADLRLMLGKEVVPAIESKLDIEK